MNAALAETKPPPDPLACFDFDALLEGAARLRPERLALSDSFDRLTFGEADRRVGALATAFRDLGLAPGQSILLAVGAPAMSFVTLAAAIRAGLQVALAPAWTDADAAARMALRVNASALVVAPGGPVLGSIESWLTAAASAPSVRLVCSIGGESIDGALRLDPRELAGDPSAVLPAQRTQARVLTFEADATPVAHARRTIIAAALDVVARARIGMRLPIISTMPPFTLAGLVAGPVASLIAGASLSWRIPFETCAFLSALDDASPAHLIAPAAMAPILARANLVSPHTLASLILVTRRKDWASAAPVPPTLDLHSSDERTPIVDLYAYGERAVAPEARGADGVPIPPAREAHYLDFDGARILALDWSRENAAPRLEGAAVSGE